MNRISGVDEKAANVSLPYDLLHPTCAYNTPLWEGLAPAHTGPINKPRGASVLRGGSFVQSRSETV